MLSRVFINYNPQDYYKEKIYRSYIRGNDESQKYFIQKEKETKHMLTVRGRRDSKSIRHIENY